MNASDIVIWSADVPDEETLFSKLGGGEHGLKIVKIDRLGTDIMGFEVWQRLTEAGYLVFDDGKLCEIPTKIEALMKHRKQFLPWMSNIMAHVENNHVLTLGEKDERDALKRFADVCLEAGILPCAVTVLTSKTDEVVDGEFNGRTPVEQVLHYLEFLVEAGFTDVVCSKEELAAIRAEVRFNGVSTNVPGIKLEDDASPDQARTGTPSGAVAAGATRLVIGRLLTNGDLAGNYARVEADLAPVLV